MPIKTERFIDTYKTNIVVLSRIEANKLYASLRKFKKVNKNLFFIGIFLFLSNIFLLGFLFFSIKKSHEIEQKLIAQSKNLQDLKDSTTSGVLGLSVQKQDEKTSENDLKLKKFKEFLFSNIDPFLMPYIDIEEKKFTIYEDDSTLFNIKLHVSKAKEDVDNNIKYKILSLNFKSKIEFIGKHKADLSDHFNTKIQIDLPLSVFEPNFKLLAKYKNKFFIKIYDKDRFENLLFIDTSKLDYFYINTYKNEPIYFKDLNAICFKNKQKPVCISVDDLSFLTISLDENDLLCSKDEIKNFSFDPKKYGFIDLSLEDIKQDLLKNDLPFIQTKDKNNKTVLLFPICKPKEKFAILKEKQWPEL